MHNPQTGLSLEKKEMDSVLQQIGRVRIAVKTGWHMIHVDEGWFYLIRDKEKLRMF